MNVYDEGPDLSVQEKVSRLDELAMYYETAVQFFPATGFLEAFLDFYEIKHLDLRLIPAEGGFRETLREVSGDDVFSPIADLTEELFGTPDRVLVFEDASALREELEGPDGLAPFFFVFDLMFCEYEGFTLCFLSGTNN